MKDPMWKLRALVLSALVASSACVPADEAVIARELYGSWVTDAPEYAGRGFVVTADSITLHQGGGIRVTYAIDKIRRTERDMYTDYLVTYRSLVSSFDFALEHRTDQIGAHMRFPNQQRVIWKRGPAPGFEPAS